MVKWLLHFIAQSPQCFSTVKSACSRHPTYMYSIFLHQIRSRPPLWFQWTYKSLVIMNVLITENIYIIICVNLSESVLTCWQFQWTFFILRVHVLDVVDKAALNFSNRNRESLNSLLHGPCQLTEARRCLYFNTSQWDSNVINVNKILPNISANRFVLQNDSTDWLQIRPLLLSKIFTRIFSK